MNEPPAKRTVVIGVGHRDRADDGIGPAVVDAIAHRTDRVVTVVREGDLAVLPLLWEADDDVVIVDAVASPGPAGELVELDVDAFGSGAGLSTHGMNVPDAIGLARRLRCLPARLRVFAVTGQDFGYGAMSRTLHRRVDRLADQLLNELGILPGRASADRGRQAG